MSFIASALFLVFVVLALGCLVVKGVGASLNGIDA
jgi:hypothetical protein